LPGAVGVGGGKAVAAAEADGSRQLLADRFDLCACAARAAGVVEAFGLFQLLAQLVEPALVGTLCLRVQELQSLASGSGLFDLRSRAMYQIKHMKFSARMAQEPSDVMQPLAIAEAEHLPAPGDRPVLAFPAKDGFASLLACDRNVFGRTCLLGGGRFSRQ